MAARIFTLVGVLIGARTPYLAPAVAERAKFRREMTTRWDERKLDTYIDHVTCVKEIQRAAMDACRARDQRTDTTDALQEMEERGRRSNLFETFVLLSDEKAATAGAAIAPYRPTPPRTARAHAART
ncbi:hypothetical protein [Streptomyces sp. NPDC048438]|uniref:hypothetical protein n=1 Tax=Streptomyces sp. NPDC048438 TaxID=3365551 RepID=UPI0037244728